MSLLDMLTRWIKPTDHTEADIAGVAIGMGGGALHAAGGAVETAPVTAEIAQLGRGAVSGMRQIHSESSYLSVPNEAARGGPAMVKT